MMIDDLSSELFIELRHLFNPVDKKKRHNCSDGKIFYVVRGFAVIYSNQKLFSVAGEGDFIGLHTIFDYRPCPLQISVEDISPDSQLYYVNRLDALQVVEQRQLYRHISILLHNRLYDICNYLNASANGDAYTRIRNLILVYIKHQTILSKITPMPSFIMKISGVSRSRVMGILREVKAGEYLTLDARGEYVLLKPLPLKF